MAETCSLKRVHINIYISVTYGNKGVWLSHAITETCLYPRIPSDNPCCLHAGHGEACKTFLASSKEKHTLRNVLTCTVSSELHHVMGVARLILLFDTPKKKYWSFFCFVFLIPSFFMHLVECLNLFSKYKLSTVINGCIWEHLFPLLCLRKRKNLSFFCLLPPLSFGVYSEYSSSLEKTRFPKGLGAKKSKQEVIS